MKSAQRVVAKARVVQSVEGQTKALLRAHLDYVAREGAVNRLNRFREAFQAIDAGDEDVLQPTVFEFRDDLEPELGTFILGDPHTKDFLSSV